MTLTLRDAIKQVYASHGAGCCLHIVLDDGNVDDEDVAFVRSAAVENRHPLCVAVADELAKLTPAAREAEIEAARC